MDKKMTRRPAVPRGRDGTTGRRVAARRAPGGAPCRAPALACPRSAHSPSRSGRYRCLRALDVPAPDSLRQWLRGADQRADRAPRRRLRLRAAVRVPGRDGGRRRGGRRSDRDRAQRRQHEPDAQQATQASLAASTMPPPSESDDGAMTLDVSAAGIPFPYWEQTVGWRATGALGLTRSRAATR